MVDAKREEARDRAAEGDKSGRRGNSRAGELLSDMAANLSDVEAASEELGANPARPVDDVVEPEMATAFHRSAADSFREEFADLSQRGKRSRSSRSEHPGKKRMNR